MKLPYLRLLYEMTCLAIIVSVGIYSGYAASRYAIYGLIKNAGFLDKMFIHTIINEHGFYEMTLPTMTEDNKQ